MKPCKVVAGSMVRGPRGVIEGGSMFLCDTVRVDLGVRVSDVVRERLQVGRFGKFIEIYAGRRFILGCAGPAGEAGHD